MPVLFNRPTVIASPVFNIELRLFELLPRMLIVKFVFPEFVYTQAAEVNTSRLIVPAADPDIILNLSSGATNIDVVIIPLVILAELPPKVADADIRKYADAAEFCVRYIADADAKLKESPPLAYDNADQDAVPLPTLNLVVSDS